MSDGHDAGAWPDVADGFFLRVDCEHGEACRWAGSAALEAAGMTRVLRLLADLRVPATFAFVGATARAFSDHAAAARAGGHALIGHSMDHARPYAGLSPARQRRDMSAMIAAIEAACGVRVRGLAAPCHGRIDAATLQAAVAVGLDYVLNLSITAPGVAPLAPAPGAPAALTPSAGLRVIWDWTPLQPGWPAFSAAAAWREWSPVVSAGDGRPVSLIVHPWIVETNGEYDLLAEILALARRVGRRFATFDQAARLARAASPTAEIVSRMEEVR